MSTLDDDDREHGTETGCQHVKNSGNTAHRTDTMEKDTRVSQRIKTGFLNNFKEGHPRHITLIRWSKER